MGKYREVRNIIMEVLSDREWHKIDELQKNVRLWEQVLKVEEVRFIMLFIDQKKKGKIEANGNGAYRICEKNVNDKEENETTQEEFYKYDDELQEARFYANKLIKLSEKIRNEIGM